MMQAGKNYIAKDQLEGADARSLYLQELLNTIKGQASGEPDGGPVAPAAPVKSPNKDKPKLSLR